VNHFATLPQALALNILSRLPVDARARCCVVCPAWRDTLEDVAAWAHADLSPESGELARPATAELLRAVCARARGQLQTLNLSGSNEFLPRVLEEGGAGALRELSCEPLFYYAAFDAAGLADVLRAAPQLRVFRTSVVVPMLAACQMLRNDAPFGPVRIHSLLIIPARDYEDQPLDDDEEEEPADVATVLELAAALPRHASSLTQLSVRGALMDAPAADAVLDSLLLARDFVALGLDNCRLSPASAPALARLLRGGVLAELRIDGGDVGTALLDEPAAVLLGAALRACATLRKLSICRVRFWDTPAAGASVLHALMGHSSLHTLKLSNNDIWPGLGQSLASTALAALVAENTPALQGLDVGHCVRDEMCLAPLLDALRCNTHLRMLDCVPRGGGGIVSRAFAQERLLPAILANSSLRILRVTARWAGLGVPPEAVEAATLVAAR
jgi:hypothetical protein